MGEVKEVKKEDIFERKTTVSNPWLDPAFNKVESLGGEPGFKVDDIPERLGLVQHGEDISSSTYYFSDLEGVPSDYGTKGQFLQTDGESKLSWEWPFWSKAGSTVYYKSGKVAIGHAAAQTVLHILTPTASDVRIETSGASDPTLSFKTTNTAHQVNFALDESAVADHVDFIGQTASVDTYFHVKAQSGQTAKCGVVVGSYRGELIMGSAGHLSLQNFTADLNLVFGINDGGVSKTITWDADVDKLKHSAGLFDFDDDNIVTTGILTLPNEGLHLLDTGGDHDLIIKPGSDLGADRILSFVTGDAARTITLSGNPTLADWFDQAVKAASIPTFGDLTISTPVNIYALSHDSFADFVASEHLAALDEDDLVSNSDTNVATQQSIKAYVDAGIGGSPLYAFKTITGITNDVVADQIGDTLTLASIDAKLTIVGTAATDTITFSVIEAQIDHDALTNFVAGEHFLQSAITVVGTIATGVWQGTAVADSYIASAATWSAKQAGDASLTSIAALTYVSGSFIALTAEDTYAVRTYAQVLSDIGAGTSNLALGETSTTAYRGDRGKSAYDHIHNLTTDINHDALTNFAAGEHFTMLDEDDMASNSATQAATQQSIKAYTDAKAGDVTAAANMTDHTLLKGDGGAKGIQDTGIVVTDADNLSNIGTVSCGAITCGAVTSNASSSFPSATTIGNLTLGSGSIVDSSGAISFGNENLSTSGTLGCGALTATTGTFSGLLDVAASGTATSVKVGQIRLQSLGVNDGYYLNNLYYDGNWRYGATGYGIGILTSVGEFSFYTAPSGTGGAVATVTERLRIGNTGYVGIGAVSSNPLEVAGVAGRSNILVSNIPTGHGGIALVAAGGGAANLGASSDGSRIVWINENWVNYDDNAFDLGIATHRWRDLWLSRNAYIAGNVGINRTNPAAKLDVYHTGGGTAVILDADAGNDADLAFAEAGTERAWIYYDATQHYFILNCGSENADIFLAPHGTGKARFGTHSAIGAETVTGYIAIKDAAGNARKVAVVS